MQIYQNLNFDQDYIKDGSFNGAKIYFINNDFMQTDIESDAFKNDPNATKYLYIKKSSAKQSEHFPKILKIGGTVQELPRGKRHVDFTGKSYYWDNFPTQYVLSYPINQFRIYVNNTDYFQSNLPGLNITTNDNAKWSLKELYFQSIIGAWIASYGCGISLQHLLFSSDVPKQITSFMRFYLYFTVRRIMRQLKVGDKENFNKFNASFLKDNYPK